MTPNNNLSVLPFYDSIQFQNHRKSYAYGKIYPLFTPTRTILPFQIRRDTKANDITLVYLRKQDGSILLNISTAIKESGLKVKRFTTYGYDLIVYPGILPMAINTPEGIYYLQISDGVETWYSDMFTIVNSIENYLKIQWWDLENLYYEGGHIDYEFPFKNTVYLCTQIGKPDYKFEEEGEERDGFFFPEKQLSEKVYNFTFLAPEYLCDAMRIIRMSDFVEITSKGELYKCDTFQMTPKWQTQGDLAAVEIEFQTDTVIKKLGRGYLPVNNRGDFNTDFNNDFNNQ